MGSGGSGYQDLDKFGCSSRVLAIFLLAICYVQLSVCVCLMCNKHRSQNT